MGRTERPFPTGLTATGRAQLSERAMFCGHLGKGTGILRVFTGSAIRRPIAGTAGLIYSAFQFTRKLHLVAHEKIKDTAQRSPRAIRLQH